MKIVLAIVMIIIGIFSSNSIRGQQLVAGQQLPEVEISVSNYYKKSINTKELRGKWVILDFWSHICLSCLQMFPKLDSLQKKYAGKVQFILANAEDRDATDRFFKTRKRLFKPDIPLASGDTILHKLFPHRSVPVQVWIDTVGTVKYVITDAPEMENAIKSFVSGESVRTVPQVKKLVVSLMDSGHFASVRYSSYLTPCPDSIRISAMQELKKNMRTMNYRTLSELYCSAYSESNDPHNGFYRPGRFVVDIPDSILEQPAYKGLFGDRERVQRYSYQINLPYTSSQSLYETMREDLTRAFPLVARVERRLTPCLILVCTGDRAKVKTKGGRPFQMFVWSSERESVTDRKRGFRNQPFKDFSKSLGQYIELEFKKPFVDAFGYAGNIDIEIDGDVLDNPELPALRAELRKYDLDLVEGIWPMDVLVIRASENGNTGNH